MLVIRTRGHSLIPFFATVRHLETFLYTCTNFASDIAATQARVKTATSALGTDSAARLQELRGNAYIAARVNARALRANIREAVRSHKFEREKLERSYRNQVMRACKPGETVQATNRKYCRQQGAYPDKGSRSSSREEHWRSGPQV